MKEDTPFGVYFAGLSEKAKEATLQLYHQIADTFTSNRSEYGYEKAVRIAQEFIDQEVQREKNVPPKTTCKAGCSFCCYLYVETSKQEAINLLPYLQPEGIPLLKRQAEKTQDTWEELPYKDRKCVFLKNNKCSAYPVRPSACRKWLVHSDPVNCNSEKFYHGYVGIISITKAELMNAVLLNYDEADSLTKHLSSFV